MKICPYTSRSHTHCDRIYPDTYILIKSLSELLVSLSTLIVLSILSNSHAQKMTNEAALRAGEVEIHTESIPKSSMPKLVAEAIFNAPPAKLWKILEDCSSYKKNMQSISSSRALGTVNGKLRCEIVIDLPWPLDDLRSVTDAIHVVEVNKLYQRSWTLVEGDYTANRGFWRLVALDKGTKTYIRYEIHIEPKTSVPNFLKKSAQKSKIPDLFEHLRSLVE